MELQDCYNYVKTLTFYGDSTELNHLATRLENLLFRNDGLTHLCDLIHLAKYYKHSISKLTNAGYIYEGMDYNFSEEEEEENYINITVITQREIDNEIWDYICSKYKNIKYYYFSNNLVERKFTTNAPTDDFFGNAKYILLCDGNVDDMFGQDEETFERYSDFFGKQITSIEDLFEAVKTFKGKKGERYELYKREVVQ